MSTHVSKFLKMKRIMNWFICKTRRPWLFDNKKDACILKSREDVDIRGEMPNQA